MPYYKEAFALSSSQVHVAMPLGTVQIFDDVQVGASGGTTRFPTPSTDPRDPLRLPAWHKACALLVVSLFAFVANFASSVIAPALQAWAFTFPREPKTTSELTYMISVNILFLGASNVLWVPLSNWLGRRPVLIIATLLLTFSSVWAGLASSYDSLLAARVFQGIGGGASETVSPAIVGDLYFIDERGRAMAVYTVFITAGSMLGGLAGGYIAFRHGWAYIFWVTVALAAACLVGTIVLVPETLYDRVIPQESELEAMEASSKDVHANSMQIEQPAAYKPHRYASTLKFRSPRGQVAAKFLNPWKTLALPGTWVVMLHYAGLVGGVVTISTVAPQLLAMPPYLWQEHVGLINLGGLIGAALGFAYTSLLADRALKRRAKAARNGVAEAEDRLPTLFLPLAIATCGFFVFGFCAQYPGPNRWVGLGAGFAMLTFGLMQIPSVGFNYLIDSYGSLSGDCFTMVTILRSIIAFAWSFFAVEWVQTRGGAEPFGIFGMLMGIFGLVTIPLWLYGKRMRIATAPLITKWT